ncbi:hypothetical protein ACH4OY_24580 [Micromonospora rubida]|uniref:Uncharacterized protein n=1 Tax=Micromonospora rubida TaxID=2697657 RepID=A0ABW7SUA8_9ACTN
MRGTVAGILASQLHMLHNRLGLSIPAECHLPWLVPSAYAAPAQPPDFHADALDAPDRGYPERSKFIRAWSAEQHPRPVEPVRAVPLLRHRTSSICSTRYGVTASPPPPAEQQHRENEYPK